MKITGGRGISNVGLENRKGRPVKKPRGRVGAFKQNWPW